MSDPPELVEESVNQLAEWILHSKHCVVYTGAGISTSAGINDFRGPQGKWSRQAMGLKPIMTTHIKLPTVCHMAIRGLVDRGIIRHVVSQNTDGLHIKSGVPLDRISELHGNSYKEICPKCGKVCGIYFFEAYHGVIFFCVLMEHRLGRGVLKMDQT